MQPKNLQAVKYKLYLATGGYNLLDRKHKALFRELVSIKNTTKQIKKQLVLSLKSSKNLVNRAKSEINENKWKRICQKSSISTGIVITFCKIMNVQVPKIAVTVKKMPPYSIYESTVSLDEAFFAWQEVKILLQKLAEAQAATKRIKAVMKKAQKRAAALKNITIPNCKAEIKYISGLMEERERDELARVRLAIKISSG